MSEEIKEQSILLDEQEVQQTLSEETVEGQEPTLPSDTTEFVMPEKFQGKSAEEIARAYTELEKLKQQKEATEEQPKEPINDYLEEGRPEGSQDITDDDMSRYVEELTHNGSLSEETYKELLDKGYSKEFVDDKVGYIKYKQDEHVNKVLAPYGGRAEFEKISNWARETLTPEQLNAVNNQLASGDENAVNAVLSSLSAGYKASTKQAPDLTLHTNQPQSGDGKLKGYATKSEFFKDSSDPRYERDPAYRRQVEAKMALTNLSDWN